MPYRPLEIAQRLGISSSTLRLWSNQFAPLLSEQARKEATDNGGPAAQRRYIDKDLHLLASAKELLDRGLTYEEARARLNQATNPNPDDAPHPNTPPSSHSDQGDVQLSRALAEAIEAKDRTIAALKESLAFMDVYLQTLLQEREDARARERHLQQQLDRLQHEPAHDPADFGRPWWKRLLALP